MSNPIFGANSLPELALNDGVTRVLTIPTSASGFSANNLTDDRAFTVYKPDVPLGAPANELDIITDAGAGNDDIIDYFMLVGHDLFTQGMTVTFAFSDDNIAYTTIFTVVPADDFIIARKFTVTLAHQFYRLRITKAIDATPSLGQLQWGTSVEAPTGIQVGFDPDAQRINTRVNASQTGNILGGIGLFIQRTATINLPLVTGAFINDTTLGGFRDFWDNHASQVKPFMFHWNPGNPGLFEKDAFFGVVQEGSSINRPLRTQLDVDRRDLSFNIIALKE